MRILIHDYAGHPFQVQLSRSLAKRGYRVLHAYCRSFQTPRGPLLKRNSDPATLDIVGIHLSEPINKYSFVKRRMQDITYGKLLAGEITQFRPDVVISGNTPLDTQKIVLKRCQGRDIKFVYWVQDMYGIAVHRVLSKRLPVLGTAIGWHYMRIERSLLRQSDKIVLITEDFRPLIDRYAVNENRIHVIQNWAPLEEIPLQSKANAWAKKHRLEDKLCMLYSGTLGMKHNPNLLLQLAIQFRKDKQVEVVVVSEGLGADWLKVKKKEMKLDNLILIEFQPFEQLPNVLASADILVAILKPDAGVFSVPSKVLTYLCARRSLLLALPLENLAARIVSQSNAGLVMDSNNVGAFVNAAKSLISDKGLRERLGRNARKYAEVHFDIEAIGKRFEEVILAPL